MKKHLPPVEPSVAVYMKRLHEMLVAVLLVVTQRVLKQVERPSEDPHKVRSAAGAACMSAYLETAQKVAERFGMSKAMFAQGLRIHADELEEEIDPPFDAPMDAYQTRH